MSDPLDELLIYAERSYIRMEAEQIISECLRIGDENTALAIDGNPETGEGAFEIPCNIGQA